MASPRDIFTRQSLVYRWYELQNKWILFEVGVDADASQSTAPERPGDYDGEVAYMHAPVPLSDGPFLITKLIKNVSQQSLLPGRLVNQESSGGEQMPSETIHSLPAVTSVPLPTDVDRILVIDEDE